eukprot:5316284-Prymnesium_polylepis.1
MGWVADHLGFDYNFIIGGVLNAAAIGELRKESVEHFIIGLSPEGREPRGEGAQGREPRGEARP